MQNLVGKCGIYCGACSIYRAQTDDEILRNEIAAKVKCSKEQVRCQGCGGITPECWCYGCKILQCLEKKGLNYCYECSDYENKSCEKHNELYETYLEAGEDIRENSEKLKTGSIDAWLSEQKEKYRCPNCHHPISVWGTVCHKCGHKLK